MAATESMDEAAARVAVERAGATTGTGNAGGNAATGDQHRRVVLPAGAQAGDLLLQDVPFAAVLLPALWATHCHVCFRQGDSGKISRCGRCQTAYYCSRECQMKDWKPDHQAECRRLKQLAQLNLHDDQKSDVVMLGRVMRRLGLSKGDASDGSAKVLPTSLVWYEEDVGSQENLLLATLAAKLKLVDASLSVQELQRMLSRFQNNNFSICDELMLEVGAGCFPLGAMINHSCDPNCAVTYSPKTHTLEARAIRQIDAGEEMVQSYVDVALPRAQRQQRLQFKYHFTCECARCSEPLGDPASRDAFLDSDISGVSKANWTNERHEQVQRVNEAFRAADASQRVSALQKLLKVQRELLHPHNILLLQSLSALFSAEMERANSRDALRYGELMLKFYRRTYPINHPMTGLHLFTLGDLLTQSRAAGSSGKSREYLAEARRILGITHGKHHHLVKLLDDRLQWDSAQSS